ncbi:MAG: hypothetical protein U1E10_16075 [Bdellovibrionales bacterium]|nr:hypothetical protein [Bdellovibrionales bacterium]
MLNIKILKSSRKFLGLLFAVSAPLLASSQFAHAQSDSETQSVMDRDELVRRVGQGKPSVGVMLGMANAEGAFESGLNYGIEASFQFSVPYSAILELSGYSADRSTSEPGLTRTKLLGKVMYNFAGTTPVIRYSYAGVGLGPIYDNVGDEKKWNVGLAPQIGFDIPLGDPASNFSLGANLAILLVSGGAPSSTSAAGVAKYWF